MLIINIFIAGLSSTAFDWTPRYKETYQVPTMTVARHENEPFYYVESLAWPFSCSDKDGTELTKENCKSSIAYLDDLDIWPSFQDRISCNSQFNQSLDLNSSPEFSAISVYKTKLNGTICLATSHNVSLNLTRKDLRICDLDGTSLKSCYYSEGSHSQTFWTYFSLRMIYQVILILLLNQLQFPLPFKVVTFSAIHAISVLSL